MKIDRSKVRKSQSELAPECQQLIQQLKEASEEELVQVLKGINTWYFGKCELSHWVDVLDRFDELLSIMAKPVEGFSWVLTYDRLEETEGPQKAAWKRELVNQCLRFTALLIEHSYTRQLYSSIEHLTALLTASDMEVVLSVLGVLYVFSKRSSFIPRLPADKRKALQQRLLYLAETWGGKENGFGLAHCCKDGNPKTFASSAGNLHFEFYLENNGEQKTENKHEGSSKESKLCSIHLENISQFDDCPGEIVEQLISFYNVPAEKQIALFSRARLAKHFPVYNRRLHCVQARLQAISILVYSNANQDVINPLLYQGLIEEVVEVLQLDNSVLIDIRACALRTLTAIIHLEWNPRINTIIEATGSASYHGFLPTLTRSCIKAMTDPSIPSYPLPFVTALFSFLYHMAYFEVGGEALVSCALMESLLRVIEYPGEEEHLTFVTRAIRIVDWIAGMDISGFQNHQGMSSILNRLEHEVKVCQPFHGGILSMELPKLDTPDEPMDASEPSTPAVEPTQESAEAQLADSVKAALAAAGSSGEAVNNTELMESEQGGITGSSAQSSQKSSAESLPMDTEQSGPSGNDTQHKMEVEEDAAEPQPGPSSQTNMASSSISRHRCLPQRAALIKAILNFLKKAIPDPVFSDSIRNVMDGSLPTSLKYIISNVEYYGPVLFLAATDVVTVYVFHEPSLLSSLQDGGLTAVVLKSLVVKDVPATRDVLASLPSILSALCLNARGLQAFMNCKPFNKLFHVLLAPEYLPAMKRRRTSDILGEAASNLGTAMDELMRHQPTLKPDAMKAIVRLLEELCAMGRDPRNIGYKVSPKSEESDADVTSQAQGSIARAAQMGDEPMSDEDDEDEDRFSFTSTTSTSKTGLDADKDKDIARSSEEEKRTYIPLMDYILNVVKFVDAILSNNSTDDHCKEFVRHKGLAPLLGILGLPNLPQEFPSSASCQAISNVSKATLMLAHEPQVLREGMSQLDEVLNTLKPLYEPTKEAQAVSRLLHELATAPKPQQALLSAQHTPLLHAITATHAYINMFVHSCRAGQSDIRVLCINQWGFEQGLSVLGKLSKLYSALVWEITLLESASSGEKSPDDCEAIRKDLDRLKVPASGSEDENPKQLSSLSSSATVKADEATTSYAAAQSTDTTAGSTESSLQPAQVKLCKQLIQAASNLGRTLSDFFGLLVKLSIGSGQRQRRLPLAVVNPPLPSLPARCVAGKLCELLTDILSPRALDSKLSSLKLRMHFYICAVGFASRLLIDERKNPYHLMLQQFMSSGAHKNMFELFHWALSQSTTKTVNEGVEKGKLPDGAGELLDAWLMLVEKLTNHKTLLDSPHTLPSQSTAPHFEPFDPHKFVASTQKRAFSAMQYLWGHKPLKVYGSRISESMLAVMCHILKGEPVISEKLGAAQPSTSKPVVDAAPTPVVAAPAPPAPQDPEINELHLQQLMDMGFTREHARDALLNTTGLEQATEYILTHPPPVVQNARDLGLDSELVELSEEDQMMRAIALSLGQNVFLSPGPPPSAPAPQPENKPKVAAKVEMKEEDDSTPLDKDLVDRFTGDMWKGCLELLTENQDIVYRICDVLVAVAKRNGDQWRDRILADILEQVLQDSQSLVTMCCPDKNTAHFAMEFADKLCTSPPATRLSSLLHLLCLLFEQIKGVCAAAVERCNVLDILFKLLDICQNCLGQLKLTVPDPATPRWLTPLMLFLDLCEKTAVASERRKSNDKCTSHLWKWFDDRSGRWYSYNANNNAAIDASYRKGDSRIRFLAGRRHYTVNFTTMVQVNEDSGNRRPIMMETVIGGNDVGNGAGAKTAGSKSAVDKEPATSTGATVAETDGQSQQEGVVFQGLNEIQKTMIVRTCASFMNLPVNASCLHAVMRLCLRLTQEHKYAALFVEEGGPNAILKLSQTAAFPGFVSLATLLLRHVLEDGENLKHTIEKVVRAIALNGVSGGNSGVNPNSVGAKEINYILRVLSPAACRNPDLFKEVFVNIIRYAIPPQLRRAINEGGEINLPPNHPQLVKMAVISKPPKLPEISEPAKQVVYQLLHALCLSSASRKAASDLKTLHIRSDSQTFGELGRAFAEVGDLFDRFSTQNRQQSISPRSFARQLTGEDAERDGDDEMALDSQLESSQRSVSSLSALEEETKKKTEETDGGKTTPKDSGEPRAAAKLLIPKSAILKLLAELVKSYGGVAQLVAEYSYHPTMADEEEFEGPVLAYILDTLLPSNSTDDSDTSSYARILLAVTAACNQSPDAQQLLVSEIKASLARALALPESSTKHSRLQSLFSLIQAMIESGPHTSQQSVIQPNNTMKLLIKKGLISDLARVPHSLDLSSPNLVATINCVLKPLEKLSSIVNQPSTATPKTQGTASGQGAQSSTGGGAQSTTVQQQTSQTTDGEAAGSQVSGGPQESQPELQDSVVQVTTDAIAQDMDVDHAGERQEPAGLDNWVDNLQVTGRAIVPGSADELLDVMDELLQSVVGPSQDGQGGEANVLGERLLSQRGIGNDIVEEATYVIERPDSEQHTSSESGGSEGEGQDDNDDHDHDNNDDGGEETMVITFDSPGGHGNIGGDEHEDEGNDDDDDDGDGGAEEGDDHGDVVVVEEEEEEEEEEDDDDDDEDEEDEEGDDQEEDEGGSDMEGDAMEMVVDDSFRIYEDDDMFMQLDDGEGFVGGRTAGRFSGTIHLPVTQAAESAAGVSSLPSGLPTRHPLLVRQPDFEQSTQGSHRLSRVRGLRMERAHHRHHGHQTHTIHVHYPQGENNPPAILQRILGPENAAEVLQLTQGSPHTRVLLGDDFQVITRGTDDSFGDEIFVDGYGDSPASANLLSSIPTALTRWGEESQILDPDSVHWCVTALKPSIFPVLEKYQAGEITKEKEEAAAARKKKEAEEKAAVASKASEEKKKEETKKTETEGEGKSEGERSHSDADKTQEEQQGIAAAETPVSTPAPPVTVQPTEEAAAPAATEMSADSSTASLLIAMHMDEPLQRSSEVRTSTPVEGELASATALDRIVSAAITQAAGSEQTPSGHAASTPVPVIVPAVPEGPSSTPETPGVTAPTAGSSDDKQAGEQSSSSNMQDAVEGNTPNQPETPSTATAAPASSEPQAGPSGEARPLQMYGMPIPEGVDPSFLEALPESIRREVLAEHLGVRPPQGAQPSAAGESTGAVNVSPEFLAALPPDVQEEVLQQQRMEQERQRSTTAPPDQPVDPATFLRNLPPSLRQSVLSDIDDSLLPVLPADLAQESQSLRREMEARHQRLMHERFSLGGGDSASAISALLRHSGFTRQLGGPGGMQFSRLFSSLGGSGGNRPTLFGGPSTSKKIVGRQLLDSEALACLLVLIFIDEPRLNTGRLHKVLRNLAYHNETRLWLISALISILRRTSGQSSDGSCLGPSLPTATHGDSSPGAVTMNETPVRGKAAAASAGKSPCKLSEYLQCTEMPAASEQPKSKQSWLSVTVDASLGCRANVFQIERTGKAGGDLNTDVKIHPQASTFICRHVLDALLFLAKNFPSSFTPFRTKTLSSPQEGESSTKNLSTDLSTGKSSAAAGLSNESDFWEILVKLDAISAIRKGKGVNKPPGNFPTAADEADLDFENSPLGNLLTMLVHPIVQRNTILMDRLLRLLSVISAALPENTQAEAQKGASAGIARVGSSSMSAVAGEQTDTPDAGMAVEPQPELETVPSVSIVGPPDQYQGPPHASLTISNLPVSETDSVTSSLVVERSPEPGAEPHEVESIDSGSVDESMPVPTEPMVVEVSLPSDVPQAGSVVDSSLLTIGGSSLTEKIYQPSEPTSSNAAVVLEQHLRLAVNVLTSGVCSEDGLEDATTFMLQISRLNPPTRRTVLGLLLEQAQHIGHTLCKDIANLLVELTEHNKNSGSKGPAGTESRKGKRPMVHPSVVLPAPPRQRTLRAIQIGEHGLTGRGAGRRQPRAMVYDLHLQSMITLTCKTSSQALLLRVLKVILQLREAARKTTTTGRTGEASREQRRPGESPLSQRTFQTDRNRSLGSVMAALEAEADAIFEAFAHMRQGERANRREAQRSDPAPEAAPQQDQQSGEVASGSGQQAAEGESKSGGKEEATKPTIPELPCLSEQLALEELWDILGECLIELGKSSDSHAVLVLQPAVEAFFLVHGTEKQDTGTSNTTQAQTQDHSQRLNSLSMDHLPPVSPGPISPGPFSPNRQMSVTSISSDLPSDTQKFLKFAETHRTVLNQILRQSTVHLADGPFAVLVDHTRVLDFDVKRRFFRQELERMDEGMRRDDLTIRIKREHVFEDSFRELHRRSAEEMKSRLFVVFEGEEGQDAGGLLREFYIIISREMFNPNYALFTTSPGDRVTYQPNPTSHCNPNHLSYFKFVGRVVAKAIYDNKLLECYFTRSFYKHILGKPVHFTDMESFDYSFYQGLVYMLEHDLADMGMELAFSAEVMEFGLNEVRDLIPNGRNIPVTDENKREYVKLVCQMKMTGAIRKQIDSFLEGFYEVIPKRLISIFNEQELELLISGLPTIDLDDLKANTEYHKYNESSLQVQWFWRALRSFDQTERANVLQFVTGSSKVPLQGFAALEGMNGPQKFQIHRDDRSTDRLPCAHTCFNQLDLPAYETYDKLRVMLLKATTECPEGFGLA